MKKAIIPILLILMIAFSCGRLKTDSEGSEAAKTAVDLTEQNKKIAAKYHDLNADDVDEIFAEGFIGHGENHEWDLDSHRDYLSSDRYMVDSIYRQIAEGKTLEEATKSAGFSEKDAWELFDQYHVRNVTAAYAELEWE